MHRVWRSGLSGGSLRCIMCHPNRTLVLAISLYKQKYKRTALETSCSNPNQLNFSLCRDRLWSDMGASHRAGGGEKSAPDPLSDDEVFN